MIDEKCPTPLIILKYQCFSGDRINSSSQVIRTKSTNTSTSTGIINCLLLNGYCRRWNYVHSICRKRWKKVEKKILFDWCLTWCLKRGLEVSWPAVCHPSCESLTELNLSPSPRPFFHRLKQRSTKKTLLFQSGMLSMPCSHVIQCLLSAKIMPYMGKGVWTIWALPNRNNLHAKW